MRVERAEHPLERGVDQVLITDFVAVHIFLAHFFHHIGQQFVTVVRAVVGDGGGLGGIEINPRAQHQIGGEQGQQKGVKDTAFHKLLKIRPR